MLWKIKLIKNNFNKIYLYNLSTLYPLLKASSNSHVVYSNIQDLSSSVCGQSIMFFLYVNPSVHFRAHFPHRVNNIIPSICIGKTGCNRSFGGITLTLTIPFNCVSSILISSGLVQFTCLNFLNILGTPTGYSES
jgi:hypothetical protein